MTAQLEAECTSLREENTQLRERLSLPSELLVQYTPSDSSAFLDQASPAREKVELFSGREPEFYRAQAIRLSTFGKPGVIACAEADP